MFAFSTFIEEARAFFDVMRATPNDYILKRMPDRELALFGKLSPQLKSSIIVHVAFGLLSRSDAAALSMAAKVARVGDQSTLGTAQICPL